LACSAGAAVAQPSTAPTTGPSEAKPDTTKTDAAKPPKTEKPAEGKAVAGDKLVVTHGEVKIGGKAVAYRATTGTYQLKDEGGKHKADLFCIAYERTPAPQSLEEAAARPVTFVFNGGPGAASVWLHLGTAGPKRVLLTPAGEAPPQPYRVVDNEFSWLDATDLVFIDPVGTGFSRAAPGEDGKQFYGVQEDVQWVSEFIRLWTTRNQRWPSPKFLAGESYGTTRAAALSPHLLRRHGIAVNGIVLISTVLDFQTIRFGGGNNLPFPLFLPTYTAAALHHKKLAADLQANPSRTLKEAEAFADGPYTVALGKAAALGDAERKQVARELARLTGLNESLILKANLRIDSDVFRKHLLGDGEQIIGRFDARLTGFDPDPLERGPSQDPSFDQFHAAYAGAFNDYVRRTLGYESDLTYDVLSGRVHPWNFGRAGNGHLNVATDLAETLRLAPQTKVMVCSGLTDLATPYWAASYTIRQMELSPALRKNISETFYSGGHMMYHEADGLKKLKADIADFVQKSVPAK
jgi:carboxypeptidase C (cathepsin A)